MSLLADFDPTEMIEMKRKTLALKKFAAQVGIGRTTMDSMDFQVGQEAALNQLIYRLQFDVLSDKIAEDTYTASYSYSVYASPWQHFKDLYMPRAFKRKYPAKHVLKHGTVEVKLDRLALYPKANVELQRDQRLFSVYLGGFESIRDEVTQVK